MPSKRRSFLLSRIRAALGEQKWARSRADADRWTVVESGGRRSKYLYKHPRFNGTFGGLTAAKNAYLASVKVDEGVRPNVRGPGRRAVPVDLLAKGSKEALAALKRAWWSEGDVEKGVDPLARSAIAPSLWKALDVRLVDDDGEDSNIPPADWTRDGLVEKHGFAVVSRSTAVIDRASGRVMGLFVLGEDIGPDFVRTCEGLKGAYAVMKECFPENCQRKGIRMFGLRYNKQETRRKRHMTTYYVARNLRSAILADRQREVVLDVARGICAAERRVAPDMGARRVEHAQTCCSPGIYPGVPIAECAATSMGLSMGYGSTEHEDEPERNQSETIAYCSEGVSPEAGYVFAFSRAKVVADLTASKASLVMVPGRDRHGTPRVRAGHENHSGVGVVVISKANLLKDEAREDVAMLRWRIENGQAGKNPFVPNYAAREGCECCVDCGRSDRAAVLVLCDVCNRGRHADCHGLKGVPKGGFVCRECASIIAATE